MLIVKDWCNIHKIEIKISVYRGFKPAHFFMIPNIDPDTAFYFRFG